MNPGTRIPDLPLISYNALGTNEMIYYKSTHFTHKIVRKEQNYNNQNRQLLVIIQQTLAYLYKCYTTEQGFKSSGSIHL